MKTRAKDIDEKITWQDITTGAEIYEPATSLLVETGDWRVMMPVFKEDKCKHCMLCVPFCPDSSIPVKDGKRLDFDLCTARAAASASRSVHSARLIS